jgi:hypothetical protein
VKRNAALPGTVLRVEHRLTAGHPYVLRFTFYVPVVSVLSVSLW